MTAAGHLLHPHTSGSTAAPKGVTLAHGPLIANGERQHLRVCDRLWLAVPLFWSFGSANAVPAIMTHGGCLVLQESFEAGEALGLIERERCSVYYGMGNMARALLEHEDHPGRRLGAMRTGLTIGPPGEPGLSAEGPRLWVVSISVELATPRMAEILVSQNSFLRGVCQIG